MDRDAISFFRKFKTELLGRGITTVFGFLIIFITLAIAIFLIAKGISTFTTQGHSLSEFLFSDKFSPQEKVGATPGQVGSAIYIAGSILISLFALIIATPFAVSSAIFMNEISPKLGKRLYRPAIEIFVGIPSVVYGWIGLTVLVPFLQDIFQLQTGQTVFAGSIVLALMIFPTITSVSTDAIRVVPHEYKEAAYSLGCTRWQMIWKVQLPAALSGIFTGIVLGLARAFGEALAVAMVIGNSDRFPKFQNGFIDGLLSSTHNLTSKIASMMGDTVNGSEANDALWTMALLLFVISFIFILIIRILGRKGEKA